MARFILAAVQAVLLGLATAQAGRADLIAFYDFEQNLNDSAASPLNLTGVGSTTFSSNTPTSGGGLVFGGRSLSIGTGGYGFNSPGGNSKLERGQFTVEAWINPAANSANTAIFAYQPKGAGNDGRGFSITFDAANKVRINIGTTSGLFEFATSTTSLTPENWYHIAAS